MPICMVNEIDNQVTVKQPANWTIVEEIQDQVLVLSKSMYGILHAGKI